MFSPQFLQRIVKSHCRDCGRLNTSASIGEQKAKLQRGFLLIRALADHGQVTGKKLICSFHVVYGEKSQHVNESLTSCQLSMYMSRFFRPGKSGSIAVSDVWQRHGSQTCTNVT